MSLAASWCVVLGAAAALAYRWRTRMLRLCAIVVGTAVVLGATFLVTGNSVAAIFEPAAKTFAGTVIVTILSVAVVVGVLPRLRSRADRWVPALLCAVLSIAYASVGMMLWRVADDGLQLATVPELRTGTGILRWRDIAPRHRIYGVLVEGRLGELPAASHQPAEAALLASYQCDRTGPFAISQVTPWLPTAFTLTLEDGSQAWAQGINSVRQAWNWPPSHYRLDECGLRTGDPVVFWGHPGATRPTGSDVRSPAIDATMVIAYGDIATFRAGFVPAAERTGRATLALAVINGLLGAAIATIGVRKFTLLRRDGTDQPPGFRWSST
ncbi:MAG: hypothetical protein KDB71_14340 [Mycobacterium sp.]|nr:hypothetical protein [Mycobacterium sp.]